MLAGGQEGLVGGLSDKGRAAVIAGFRRYPSIYGCLRRFLPCLAHAPPPAIVCNPMCNKPYASPCRPLRPKGL